MNTSPFRAIAAVIFALAMVSPSLAQQKPAPSPAPQQQAPAPAAPPAVATPPAVTTQPVASPAQAPAPPAPHPSPPASPDPRGGPAESGSRSLKSTTVALRELSPWSMFLAADVLVKAVMIGLAFASLVTWTIFIAKVIELSLVQRKLLAALAKIGDSGSLSEAQFALGAKDSVLSALLAAAMREARLSAGISSDSGIKERAASSFA